MYPLLVSGLAAAPAVSAQAGGSHVALDLPFFVVLVLVSPMVDRLWLYPRLVRATANGVPGARSRFYLCGIVTQWSLVVCALALWASGGRTWEALGLGRGGPLRLGIGLGFAGLVFGLLRVQRRAILARPERIQRARRMLDSFGPLLPHTPGEHRGFMVLSITAGICEEVLFRGFVPGYLVGWTGPILAIAISCVLFGFAHVYLGAQQVLRTSVVGALLAGIVVASGSLWPAMIVHATLDLNSGDLGFHALSRVRDGRLDPGSPADA